MIDLWASWCSPCFHDLAEWKALQEKLEAADFHVVAFAATGNSPKAIQFIELSFRIPIASGDKATASWMKKLLPLFKAEEPYLEPAPQSQ
ncbi:MAG: thiol-disulfide isomerase/thioredoxin [Akkermansiaceae bacterium]